jgi:hypothetical protein
MKFSVPIYDNDGKRHPEFDTIFESPGRSEAQEQAALYCKALSEKTGQYFFWEFVKEIEN